MPGKAGSEQILSNLTELIRNSLKMEARIFTQEELDLKSQITDYPIIKRFEEITGIGSIGIGFTTAESLRSIFGN